MYEHLSSIRTFYRLEELLDREELEPYSKRGNVGLTFLNLGFKEIWQDSRAPELCDVVANVWGERDCRACTIQANPPSTEEAVDGMCVAGVRKIRSAVLVHGRAIGYVSGPPIPHEGFFKHDHSKLPLDVREWLQLQLAQPADPDAIRKEVEHIAQRLGRRCTLERRLKILRDARSLFVAAKDPGDVLEITCRALDALFGEVDICFYVYNPKGFLELVIARGPLGHAMPRILWPEQGHIGEVVRQRKSKYVADLRNDTLFIHPDPDDLAASSFTVPIPWGADEVPGALQAASREREHFGRYDRQAMEAVAEMAGLAAVKLFLKAAKSIALPGRSAADTWASISLAVAATASDRPVEILQARNRIYQALADEALRVSGARAACVGTWDVTNETVRVSASAGEGWTDTAKSILSKPGMRNAVRFAIDGGTELHVSDTDDEQRFRPILPFTRSLYIVPFKLKRALVGVLSLASPVPNGFTDAAIGAVKYLIGQLEEVLSALDAREESLFRRFASDMDLETLSQQFVDIIWRTFRVRSCSLFLKLRGAERVELFASTERVPKDKYGYDFGEGLTGWIAKTQLPLRVWNTKDERELDAIFPGLRPKEDKPWREESAGEVNHSYLGVPLVAGNRLVGVVRLKVKEDLSPFTHEEETSLLNVAERLAAMIDSIQVTEALAAENRQRESEAKLQRHLMESDLQGVSQLFTDEFMRNTDAIAAKMIIIDETPGHELEIATSAGLLRGLNFDDNKTARGALGILPKRVDPLFLENVGLQLDWRAVIAPIAEHFLNSPLATIESVATLPFFIDEDEKIFAVLLFCWNSHQDLEANRQSLIDLTRRAAIALRPTALRRHTDIDLADRMNELRYLRQIGVKLAQTHDLGPLMNEILEVSIKESRMENGSIRLLDDGSKLYALACCPADPPPLSIRINELFNRSLKSEKCRVFQEDSNDELWVAHGRRATAGGWPDFHKQIRTTVHAPIHLQGNSIGLILLESTQPREVSKPVLEFLGILGLYAAGAIEFARVRDELNRRIELAEPLAMMGTMLQGFLHVIRNRINDLFAILGNLLDHPLEKAVREKAAEMRDELKQLHVVCNDLALFTRTDPVSFSENVVLTQVVERTVSEFSSRLRDRDITLVRKLYEPSPVLTGNPIQIEIAFKMIVQNAIEAMDKGGALTVESSCGRSEACVRFCDTGQGMDARTIKQCMQPFFTTKQEGGGTGLGLAAVFGIMTRHRGRVEIESEIGTGSTFTLYFPVQEESRPC